MRIRSVRWKVEEQSNGSYVVREWRKIVKRDMSLREAYKHISGHMSENDRVARIEPDGYAFDATRAVNRIR